MIRPPVAAAILVLLAFALLPPRAAHAEATPEYFRLPAGVTVGLGLAEGPDGTMWFGAGKQPDDALLVRAVPAQLRAGTADGLTVFPTVAHATCCATQIRAIAWDPTK